MKFMKVATTGLLLVGMGSAALGNPPQCIDRPTPPPCCADGHSIANPASYGWYATRWRRWPLENMDQLSAGQTAPGIQPGTSEVGGFELPEAKDEDQKAPPPSTPKPEDQQLRTQPGNAPPESGAGGRAIPPQPPAMQMTPPAEPREPIMRRLPDYEPTAPSPKGVDSLGPQSDLDPPPSLPFGPQQLQLAPPIREAQQAPAQPIRQVAPARVAPPSDDPPPSLPGTLATLSK